MKFRLTPRLALRLLRELRAVVKDINTSLTEASPGGRTITADEAFDIGIVIADAVVSVIADELSGLVAA